MTSSARSTTLSRRAVRPSVAVRVATVRRLILALGLALGFATTSLMAAAPAGAVVEEVAAGFKVGLQPRNGTTLGTPGQEPRTFENEHGNVVLHGTSSEYLVYWDPNAELDNRWVYNIDHFFREMGEAHLDTPFGLLGQYRDRSNTAAPFHGLFKGSYSDTEKFPTAKKCTDPGRLDVCLTDAQLRAQLQSFIAEKHLPKGMSTIYYLVTPPDVAVCLQESAENCSDYALSLEEEEKDERKSISYEDSFCSYHSDINPDNAVEGDANTILYAAIPWVAVPSTSAFDCQDGGWDPEEHKEKREAPKALSTKEEEERVQRLREDSPEKRAEEEKARALEGPHIEEPNQASKPEGAEILAALSDVLVNQIAEQEMDTVTDPLLTSWQDKKGNEVTDLCRNYFDSTAGEEESHGEIAGSVTANQHTEAGTLSNVTVGAGRYYINNIFNLSDENCSGGLGLIPAFTAPNPVNTGEIIAVDGMETELNLFETKAFGVSGAPTPTFATFSWNFGDGTPEVSGYAPGAPPCETPWLSPCAASALHTYQYGGKYTVTLTITDVDGDKGSVSHEVDVSGPSPPAPPSPPASSSTSSSTPSTPSTPEPAPSVPPAPTPVAAALIVPQSLHTALHKGLDVDYSVNEKVAGRFEVLLSETLARKLHISGTPATELPAGSSPELVIAKALVVTTKAGRSAVHIQFSKATAARLARAHKVPLMLRMIVRNTVAKTTTLVTVGTLTA